VSADAARDRRQGIGRVMTSSMDVRLTSSLLARAVFVYVPSVRI